jgi:hypothetical protein
MLTTWLEPHTELQPVRQCPRCRRKWPADWDYCRDCVVWLPGHETVDRITRLVPRGVSGAEFAAIAGSVFMACELRLGSEHPAAHEISEALTIVQSLFAGIESRHGSWSFTAGRGVIARWLNASTGAEAAAEVAQEAGAHGLKEQHADVSHRPSLQIGVVAIGDEAQSAEQASLLAIRMASLALPNTALFSISAYEMIAERFDFQGVQPVLPRAESLAPVFRLLRRKQERSGTHHIGPEKTPLVGGQTLLDALCRYQDEAAQGQSIVLHLVGDPGHGKSKLLREWLAAAQAAGRLDGWLQFRCHGVPYAGYPFRGWQLLFSQYGPAGMPDRINNAPAVLEVLRERRRPVLIVVDDLHWLDVESRTLLTGLIAANSSVPMMLVLAYRPSFTAQVPQNPQARHCRLRLEGLGRHELSSLLASLGRKAGIELPVKVQEQILTRAAGSPLYVEEAVEHLAATAKSGTVHAELPPSLLDLLILRVRWALQRTLPLLRRRQREWLSGPLWNRPFAADRDILRELEDLEEKLSSWLDRLDLIEDDAGSDRVQEILCGLQKVDQELGLLNLLVGRQRPHRGRLTQALSRIARLNNLEVQLE